MNACVQAGATHISAMALHLRAGVRQHFFDWLTANRPELVREYECRFQKAYQPAKDRDALAVLVRTFVDQARGKWGSPRAARALNPRQPAAAPAMPPEPAAQLGLSL